MRCTTCGADTAVATTAQIADGFIVHRRRVCTMNPDHRFSSFEIDDTLEDTILKYASSPARMITFKKRIALAERNTVIVSMLRAGEKCEVIALQFNLSLSMVATIARANGFRRPSGNQHSDQRRRRREGDSESVERDRDEDSGCKRMALGLGASVLEGHSAKPESKRRGRKRLVELLRPVNRGKKAGVTIHQHMVGAVRGVSKPKPGDSSSRVPQKLPIVGRSDVPILSPSKDRRRYRVDGGSGST